MNELPTPPKRFDTTNKWGAALNSVIQGNVIFLPDVAQPWAVGMMQRGWIKSQGFIVRTRSGTRENISGTYAWVAKRGVQ